MFFSLLTNQNENSNDSYPSSESEESNDNTKTVAGSQNAVKKGYCVKQGGVVSINQLLFRWMIYLYNSDFTGSKIFGQKLKLRAIVCPIFLSISYGQDLVNERSLFFFIYDK